jgi:hypothetical protein
LTTDVYLEKDIKKSNPTMTEEDLRKKVEALERENEQLKAGKRPQQCTVREEKFKGHPVLVFEGPSLIRPMTLGLGKLKALQQCWGKVEAFLVKHSKPNTSPRGNEEKI